MPYSSTPTPYGQTPVVVDPTTSAITLVDTTSTPINPAKEDGNLAGIKADTDALAALISSGALSVAFSPRFVTHADTYTAVSTGALVDRHTNPVSQFAIQTTTTGNATWTIVLEVSLDGVNFTTILTSKNPASIVFSGSLLSPSLYFRTRVTNINLGTSTNIIVTVLAQ